MPDVNTNFPVTLLDAINVSLSCIGETPVTATTNTSTNVVLAKQIIEEVGRDVQSKGWWFNQGASSSSSITIYGTRSGTDTNGDVSFHSSIPEEARRYISIRAARVLQSRFVGSEELQKFSFQEEQVSLAILTQAHVRNGGNSTSFNSFPADLKGMGVEEVMFLQQSAEEKLLSLRLVTELKSTDKLVAETSLIADQEALVEQQKLTEVQETSKRAAEKALIDSQELKTDAETTLTTKQGGLVDAQKSQTLTESLLRAQQALTELKNTDKVASEKSLLDAQATTESSQQSVLGAQATNIGADTTLKGAQATDVGADTTLKGKQGSLVDAQATDVAADTTLKGKQGSLVDAQATDVAADTTLKGKQGSLVDAQSTDVAADTTLKGKQGSLVDAQATDVAADTTLKGKQGSLVDAQATDVSADTTLKGKQGSLVDAQATDVAADTTLKGKQGSALDADTALKTSQKTQLDAQTAIEATAEKNFYDGVVAGTQKTYRDFAAEMRMMGIQEAQFQSTPAYKKVELIKDAEKLRKQHTESNRYRMNTRITYANGGLRGDNVARQFYGLASTHPAYQNPVTVVSGYIWHGFSDTTGGSTGSPTASGKHLANGNPKAYNLSTNFTSGLNEDGTSFVNDTTGNAGITFAGDTFASRSFMSNYAVHVRRPNDIEVVGGKTFSVTFFVNFHQPNNDATGSYLLEAIADNTLTVYVDDVQVGVKEYQPLRWEDENTLAFDPFNWDRPQDILLTNITSGFHKVTLEFSNLTDTPNVYNIQTPDYVAGHTDDKLVGVGSNPVAVAARLRPLKSADITDDYNKANNVYTALGQDGNSFFIWDTTKQFGLGTYDESDIEVVNDVLRLIGEPPAKEFHENALAIETYNLIRKTDIELQGRGWFFNTEKDILLGTDIGVVNPNDNLNTSDSKYKKSFIQVDDSDFNKGGVYDYVLSFEANDYKTQLRRLGSDDSYRVLYNTKTREIYDWFPSDGVKGTAIVHKELSTCPQKYKEYLTVRVATILTELYPQSGIDIQRLPKMEQELETYFKDIQADEANYSVFDNYDTASRIGINRNYDIS